MITFKLVGDQSFRSCNGLKNDGIRLQIVESSIFLAHVKVKFPLVDQIVTARARNASPNKLLEKLKKERESELVMIE